MDKSSQRLCNSWLEDEIETKSGPLITASRKYNPRPWFVAWVGHPEWVLRVERQINGSTGVTLITGCTLHAIVVIQVTDAGATGTVHFQGREFRALNVHFNLFCRKSNTCVNSHSLGRTVYLALHIQKLLFSKIHKDSNILHVLGSKNSHCNLLEKPSDWFSSNEVKAYLDHVAQKIVSVLRDKQSLFEGIWTPWLSYLQVSDTWGWHWYKGWMGFWPGRLSFSFCSFLVFFSPFSFIFLGWWQTIHPPAPEDPHTSGWGWVAVPLFEAN